jgi:hypothetical protein
MNAVYIQDAAIEIHTMLLITHKRTSVYGAIGAKLTITPVNAPATTPHPT